MTRWWLIIIVFLLYAVETLCPVSCRLSLSCHRGNNNSSYAKLSNVYTLVSCHWGINSSSYMSHPDTRQPLHSTHHFSTTAPTSTLTLTLTHLSFPGRTTPSQKRHSYSPPGTRLRARTPMSDPLTRQPRRPVLRHVSRGARHDDRRLVRCARGTLDVCQGLFHSPLASRHVPHPGSSLSRLQAHAQAQASARSQARAHAPPYPLPIQTHPSQSPVNTRANTKARGRKYLRKKKGHQIQKPFQYAPKTPATLFHAPVPLNPHTPGPPTAQQDVVNQEFSEN